RAPHPFPYTTLFRSQSGEPAAGRGGLLQHVRGEEGERASRTGGGAGAGQDRQTRHRGAGERAVEPVRSGGYRSEEGQAEFAQGRDRKSTRLNSKSRG